MVEEKGTAFGDVREYIISFSMMSTGGWDETRRGEVFR